MPDAAPIASGDSTDLGWVRHSRRMHDTSDAPPESEFRLLVDGVLDYAIFMLDPTGRIVSWNAGAERIKGYRPEDILGRHFSVFYPPEEVAAGKPDRELEVAVAEGRLEDEGWRVRQDGSRFWANVVITALFDGAGVLRGFGKVTRDMTEQRMAQRALSERRRLLSHLVEAQEVERRRIAWDVHDDSIQAMVAVGMRLQLLAARLPEEHARVARQADEAVRATIGRLRNLVFRLQPPPIDRRGLVDTLAEYLDDTVAGWGLTHELRHQLDAEPPPETAITIFRICQEALLNVRKHAQAAAVHLRIATADVGTLVRVADDGIGLPRERAGGEHFGLIEMRERAETAGGWFSITNQEPRGTVVEFWLPNPPPIEPEPRP